MSVWCISCAKQTPDEGVFEFTMNKSSLGSPASYFWIGVQTEDNVQWTLSVSFADGQPWAALRSSQGQGSGMVACDYEANLTEVSRFMTITLTSSDGRRSTSYSISQCANLPPGSMPEWMELPEAQNGCEFYPHYFKKGYYTYRNYSIGWSPSDRLSVWVAYPLNDFYTKGSSGYTKTWAYDPQVGNDSQPELFYGYKRSTDGEAFDRGHQLPSADRQCCEIANNQTFFFTNMTPQRNSFNTGVWVSLEGKVRSFSSKCDTLYVVTGAVIGSSPKYAYDNNNRPCPVPSHYFKALLAYKNSASFGHSGWQAAGFWLDHSTSTQTRMPIRTLEREVGFDLFPNLKPRVGESLYDTIETETPSSFWN